MEDRRTIAIRATIADSYGFVWRHPRALVRILWLPVLAVFLLNLLFGTYAPGPPVEDLAAALPLLGKLVLNVLLQTVVAAAVLVAWHRVVLFGDEEEACVSLAFGRRELRYLATWLGLGLGFLLVFALATGLVLAALFLAALIASRFFVLPGLESGELFFQLQVLSLLLAVPLATYFAVRLSLVLPALATDRRRSLGQAWAMSGGNGWRLAFASILAMLPLELASIAFGPVVKAAHGTLAHLPLALLAAAILMVMVVLAGTVLSIFSLALDSDRGGRAARHGPGPAGGLIPASS